MLSARYRTGTTQGHRLQHAPQLLWSMPPICIYADIITYCASVLLESMQQVSVHADVITYCASVLLEPQQPLSVCPSGHQDLQRVGALGIDAAGQRPRGHHRLRV